MILHVGLRPYTDAHHVTPSCMIFLYHACIHIGMYDLFLYAYDITNIPFATRVTPFMLRPSHAMHWLLDSVTKFIRVHALPLLCCQLYYHNGTMSDTSRHHWNNRIGFTLNASRANMIAMVDWHTLFLATRHNSSRRLTLHVTSIVSQQQGEGDKVRWKQICIMQASQWKPQCAALETTTASVKQDSSSRFRKGGFANGHSPKHAGRMHGKHMLRKFHKHVSVEHSCRRASQFLSHTFHLTYTVNKLHVMCRKHRNHGHQQGTCRLI